MGSCHRSEGRCTGDSGLKSTQYPPSRTKNLNDSSKMLLPKNTSLKASLLSHLLSSLLRKKTTSFASSRTIESSITSLSRINISYRSHSTSSASSKGSESSSSLMFNGTIIIFELKRAISEKPPSSLIVDSLNFVSCTSNSVTVQLHFRL